LHYCLPAAVSPSPSTYQPCTCRKSLQQGAPIIKGFIIKGFIVKGFIIKGFIIKGFVRLSAAQSRRQYGISHL
jgi:hypothetical protein